jgi:uncharacterized membrane protein YdbT with pleckstrin-like domain
MSFWRRLNYRQRQKWSTRLFLFTLALVVSCGILTALVVANLVKYRTGVILVGLCVAFGLISFVGSVRLIGDQKD